MLLDENSVLMQRATRLTKVSLITDIQKARRLFNGNDITPEEFDGLYDLSVEHLEEVLESFQLALSIKIREKCL